MENASKALIIAGAILIAIVLISVGIMVVNGANNSIADGIKNMDQQAKQMFNNQFQSYEGTRSGTQVKALISAIVASNNEYYETEGKTVKIEFDGITGSSLTATSPIEIDENTADAADEFAVSAANLRVNINNGAKYDVTLTTTAATGLISSVKITKVQ